MVDTYRNPTYIQTNHGKIVEPSWENNRGILNSHIVPIDSRLRDYNLYPSANNFKVRLAQIYHNVRSIELLDAIIPIKGSQLYVSLKLSGSGRILNHEAGETTALAPNVSNPLLNDSFALIALTPDFATDEITHWEKGERRHIHYYQPPLSTLDTLQITLEEWGAVGSAFDTVNLYGLATEAPPVTTNPDPTENILLIFEIVCSD